MINEIDSVELGYRMEQGKDLFLLDIRTEAEVAHGMLPGSSHLPMHLLPLRLDEFPQDRDIILYCRSGVRSYHACKYLVQNGFPNVINLKGGIIDWARQGYEILPFA